jgi:predicted dehydrogenase
VTHVSTNPLASRFPRRTLLAAGAAGLALPTIVPARVLAGQGTTPPSDVVRFGLIGCGKMGHADAIHLFNTGRARLVAISDVDTSISTATREKFEKDQEPRYGTNPIAEHRDFRELIARDDIDAVVVATPDHWHAIPVIEACKAGKDIYCEKPLSLTIREARAMADAVKKHGRVLQTGSQQRSDARFRRACELVRSGAIGKVQRVIVRVGGPSKAFDLPAEPLPEGIDWETWLGPAPQLPYNKRLHPNGWRAYREFAGGGTTDWGAHHFDIVQWALDADSTGPLEAHPPGKDHKTLTLVYASGTLVQHAPPDGLDRVEWPSPPEGDTNGITFIGEDGWIEVDRKHLRTFPESLAAADLGTDAVCLEQSPGHHRNFLDCMQSRKQPICHVEVGCRSVTVCHLVNIAYWTGRSIRWNPSTEEVVGDADAAAWLDRPRRPPWDGPLDA